jgi:hypothetical protein
MKCLFCGAVTRLIACGKCINMEAEGVVLALRNTFHLGR